MSFENTEINKLQRENTDLKIQNNNLNNQIEDLKANMPVKKKGFWKVINIIVYVLGWIQLIIIIFATIMALLGFAVIGNAASALANTN